LRQCVDVEKRTHDNLYRMASGNYVFIEFVKAVLGYHEYQTPTSEPLLERAKLTPITPSSEVETLLVSANEGNSTSQLRLGKLFLDGHGVTQNYVAAHFWFNLASAAGLTEAQQLRDTVAVKMTPAQIAEAQKRASEWRPTTPQTEEH